MSIKLKRKTDSVEQVIETVYAKMKQTEPDSKEFTTMAQNVKTLCEAKSKEKDHMISLDTLIVAGVSLVEILAILNHEKLNVITGKAMGFVLKGRV